jgi:predicted kinase
LSVLLLTGIQASGKSTVAQALAEQLPESVHVRGDLFRRMVVNGRVDMGPADPPEEAIRQLRLRYDLACLVADRYAEAGFQVILQDIVLGPHLAEMVERIHARPLYVVVLAPRAEVVEQRDAARRAARSKVAYKPGDLGVAALDGVLRTQTPRIGLWIDTSEQTVEQTVQEVLARLATDAVVQS